MLMSTKCQENEKKMTTNVMMIGYDMIFTMEHFSLCQSMILTTSFFFLATVRSSKNLQKDKLSRYVILSVIATTVVQGVPKYEKLSFFEKFFIICFKIKNPATLHSTLKIQGDQQ
jgi:hypothetical protein